MIIFSKFYNDWHIFKEKVRDAFSEIFSLLSARLYLAGVLFINTTLWVFSGLFYRQVNGELIVLHYNVDFGVDFFGRAENIFVIPAIGLFFLAFNFFLLMLFADKKNFNFICHLVLGSTLLANILLSLSLGPIYLINFT
ncbi:MAG: hypothetical protein WC415_02615 [Patescibacteria group bacterium]|jgi:hypothetical protein